MAIKGTSDWIFSMPSKGWVEDFKPIQTSNAFVSFSISLDGKMVIISRGNDGSATVHVRDSIGTEWNLLSTLPNGLMPSSCMTVSSTEDGTLVSKGITQQAPYTQAFLFNPVTGTSSAISLTVPNQDHYRVTMNNNFIATGSISGFVSVKYLNDQKTAYTDIATISTTLYDAYSPFFTKTTIAKESNFLINGNGNTVGIYTISQNSLQQIVTFQPTYHSAFSTAYRGTCFISGDSKTAIYADDSSPNFFRVVRAENEDWTSYEEYNIDHSIFESLPSYFAINNDGTVIAAASIAMGGTMLFRLDESSKTYINETPEFIIDAQSFGVFLNKTGDFFITNGSSGVVAYRYL